MANEMQEPKINIMEKWLFSVAAKKVTYAVLKLLASVGAAKVMEKYGITINTDTMGNVLPGVIFAGLEAAHDFLKLKLKWKWL